MKKWLKWVLIVLGVLIIISLGIFVYSILNPRVIGEPAVPSNFEECLAAGNPAMESYPRQCHDSISGRTFTEEIFVTCLPEQRNVDACIEIYQPVCGTVHVQCITTPCDPVKETFENSCKACTNELVEGYFNGECA
jgi:hypothetical protein